MYFEQARCRETDPDLFFTDDNHQQNLVKTAQAKAICRPCAHVVDCAAYALRNKIEHGVWGALDPDDRFALRFGTP